MKFTDGFWRMRAGVTPHFATQVQETKIENGVLTVYAATERVVDRGDTLDLPMLTAQYSSPMPNVIRVRLYHHKGGRPGKPQFQLEPLPPGHEGSIVQDEHSATLTSGTGALSVNVQKRDWRVEFRDGEKVVTGSGGRAAGYMETDQGSYIHEQLDLAVGEYVYGLGERFTPFVKNGQSVDIWNEDGGTSSEQAYKNVPFYMTNRGYGVFIDHPERVSLEVGSEKVERVQFSVSGEVLEYFVIYGPSSKEVLERYTALTGRPALPPAWSFGLWLTTSFTTSYDEETVTSFIQGMADRDLPLHVFHFDCFWMKGFHWVDLQWDETMFPDPRAMLARLKARGLHICVWLNPYVAQQSSMFDEGVEGGYFVKKRNGDVWQWDRWQAGMALVDFTNPQACQWYASKLRVLLEMGVDCFKSDFGERIPTDVVYHDGSDPLRMHNYYSYLYNKVIFDVLEGERGKGDAVLFARSATAGCQRFPVHWGGDSTASYPSMAESLRGGLSLCLSGFGFWSHDIGGFEQTATPDLYKRWCAYGLLSSHSRLHGSRSYRVPWLFDEEAVDVLRFFTKLKCRLMPYLFGTACETHERGIPSMRAMLLEFPEDPGCHQLDRQYMLGDSLLVAPIFSPDGSVDYYLPEGRWTNFLTGSTVEGGRWVREWHDYMSLPLMVRPNSLIPVGSNEGRPDYDFTDGVTFHLFELEDKATCRAIVPTREGAVAAVAVAGASREGNKIIITVRVRVEEEGLSGKWQWRVMLRGTSGARYQVDGGTATVDRLGLHITPDQGNAQVTIKLSAR